MGTFVLVMLLFCFIAAYSKVIGVICLGLLAMIAGENFIFGVIIAGIAYILVSVITFKMKYKHNI